MKPEEIERFHLRAEVFADGAKGMKYQEHRCVEEPRITMVWRKPSKYEKATYDWRVDGVSVGSGPRAPVAAIAEALKKPKPEAADE